MLRSLRVDSSCIGAALAVLLCLNLLQLGYLFSSHRSCSDCGTGTTAPLDGHRSAATGGNGGIRHSRVAMSSSVRQPEAAFEARGRLIERRSAERPDTTCAVFILFSWNYDLFWTSLQTYDAAGWTRRIIVIDNSDGHRLLHDPKVNAIVGEVIPTRVQLTFSQLQNFIASIAIERDYNYYFWGHADVALVASNASASFAEEVLQCMDHVMDHHPDWGILYFKYDWFSAIRTSLVRQVKYDIFITVYMSDCDFYPRVRAAGYQTLESYNTCPEVEHLTAYDLVRPTVLPLHNYDKYRQALEAEQNVTVDRNAWKRREWRLGEDAGWDNWEQSSLRYFRAKWGTDPERADECKDVEVDALTDKVRLRQQPFAGHKPVHTRRLSA
ncbi:hypothetical protein COCOBI_07-1510 [Coccomyxa sp. Obi]|nr:hypothetical protein COCOBI_07-1510 [Coccomyxa sp. Obi]